MAIEIGGSCSWRNGVAYQSSAPALAALERAPQGIEIDGIEAHAEMAGSVLILPRGQHLVTIFSLSPDKKTER